MEKWDELKMADRARILQLAVKSGITNLNAIKEHYNKFDNGGLIVSEASVLKAKKDSSSPLGLATLIFKGIAGAKEDTNQVTPKPIDYNEIRNRQAWAESAGDDRAISPAGAMGKFQIMPNTLSSYQEKMGTKGDINDPNYNGQVRDWQVNNLLKSNTVIGGNPSDSVMVGKMLAAYNWGQGRLGNALEKAKKSGKDIYNSWEWLEYLPKESQDYVNFILRNQDTGGHRTNILYEKSKSK